MDEKQLQEIEERAAMASKGPWAAVGVDRRPLFSHTWRVQGPSFMNLANFIDAEDAAFIAASRQDIPDLLAEVKRLRDELVDGVRYVNVLVDGMTADQFNVLVDMGKVDGIRAWLELNGEGS